MPKQTTVPVALTIAGSDSGGGAGIQADLKTFAAFKTHGTSVITCLTAQNPARVTAVHGCPPLMIRAQLEAIFSEMHPAVAKTGMLFSPAIVSEVADFLKKAPLIPLVVDPVMIATSGAILSKPAAVKALTRQLLPLATVVTPNLPEAEVLTGETINTIEDLRGAARRIYELYDCAALVKGGHLENTREAVDFLFDGTNEFMLTAPFIRGVATHGTGCAYSAALTAGLARGMNLREAATAAKTYITEAISRSYKAGNHTALGHFCWRDKICY
jgi:hydroxymethylpyrimidine/phosphomethylpyrimidine kinase